MKFKCPKCPEGVIGLRESVCPECGHTLTVQNTLAHGFNAVWQPLWSLIAPRRRSESDAGPKHEAPSEAHPEPSNRMTFKETTGEVGRWWRRFLVTATPVVRAVVQWGYLLLSVAGLLYLLAYVESHYSQGWLQLAGLSVVYMAVLTLLAKLVVPRKTIQAVVLGASGVVKLGLICNYFALLLLLQVLIATWWKRALMMAGLFGISLIGLWVFKTVLMPMFQRQNGERRIYDPTEPQGRRGRYD